MIDRRSFLEVAAMSALAGGCRALASGGSERVPYGETVGDRLWMWGHHAMSFAAQLERKCNYNLPLERRIDMADACRTMGVPGCFVVRWFNLPRKRDLDDYMRQFADTRRVGFSITDGAEETVEEKIRLGLGLADRMPNLTSLVMDDFWCKSTKRPPMTALHRLRTELDARGMKLSVVLYADQNGLKREYREVIDLCDEVTFWFWYGKNVRTIEDQVGRLKDLIGADKPVLLGQYMYDFGAKRELPGRLMEAQLAATTRLLASRAIDGVIFHCTPLVDMDLDAVRLSREWIRAHARERWGTGMI